MKDIKSKYGAESIAFIRDPRPNVNYYGQRFINALGSANWYTHGASCNLSLTAGYNSVLGNSFSTDNGNAKMLMFIGRSYADGIRPSAVKGLADLAESKKAKIVMVDPRYNSSCRFADQWVPILPGNDLAFVLGMCNVLITENLYNHDFVDQYVTGFDEFKAEVAKFTPDWASRNAACLPKPSPRLRVKWPRPRPLPPSSLHGVPPSGARTRIRSKPHAPLPHSTRCWAISAKGRCPDDGFAQLG